MTCPIDLQSPTVQRSADPAPDAATERFERVMGSTFVALFAGALFDQAMLPAVSAALEDTGRIRNDPWQRALRTAASDQIIFAGTAADAETEAQRLVALHRDVKGVGADGTRYSALAPESWNWILISTFFMNRNAVQVISGRHFTAAENQRVWNRFRELTIGLQLPGKSKLIDDYQELSAYYDRMAAERLESTPTLQCAAQTLAHPPRPDFLPAAAEPFWRLTAPVAGHVVAVLSYGIMRPRARAMLPMTWTRRHEMEFAALSRLVQLGYRLLPRAVTDTPLVRNRRDYDRIMAGYKRIGLTSFAPDA